MARRKHSSRLIGLDWGSTSLRAYLLDDQEIQAERVLPLGILPLGVRVKEHPTETSEIFQQAFEQACGDWLQQSDAPVLISGMAGSAQGWHETPYLQVPLDISLLGSNLVQCDTATGRSIHFVPGLIQRTGLVDVLRGEETQVAGILDKSETSLSEPELLIGLPGTHSKWVSTVGQRIRHFETFMTGEVYAALCAHTILARTMRHGSETAWSAFDRGVNVAASAAGKAGVLSNIFSVRTLGLTNALLPEEQSDYLSGLLIGHELIGLLKLWQEQGECIHLEQMSIVLIGEDSLCARYRRALKIHGCDNVRIAADATPQGLWQVAAQAGLVASAPPLSQDQIGRPAQC